MTTGTLERQQQIIIGVDAHKHTHHAVIITSTGKRVTDSEFPATTDGYANSPPGPPIMVEFTRSEWNRPGPTLRGSPGSSPSTTSRCSR